MVGYVDIGGVRVRRPQPGSQSFDRTLNGIYLHLAYLSLGAIDSLMVTVDAQKQPRAFFFQITIASRHPFGATQLLAMWDELPGEVKKVPPAIILVVSLELGPGTRFNR